MSNATSVVPDVENLPSTVLQAVYHAVTGKTENISRSFFENVKIERSDIDRLYGIVKQQIEQYAIVCPPTVTVFVISSEKQKTTYSSWERFKSLDLTNAKVTSEIIIKVEFVARNPAVNVDQRMSISISIDSSLPTLRENPEMADGFFFPFLLIVSSRWKTVDLSIDFVDFVAARNFSSSIEEWFLSLEKITTSRFDHFVIKKHELIRDGLRQLGKLLIALFLSIFLWKSHDSIAVTDAIAVVIFAITLHAIYDFLDGVVFSKIIRRAQKNIIPSVIILGDLDRREYNRVMDGRTNSTFTMGGAIVFVLVNMAINIASSFVAAHYFGISP